MGERRRGIKIGIKIEKDKSGLTMGVMGGN